MQRGTVWEAASPLAKNLNNLIAIVDFMVGKLETKSIFNLNPFADKWKSFGWTVKVVNVIIINSYIKI